MNRNGDLSPGCDLGIGAQTTTQSLVASGECDDGNNVDGDNCTATRSIEP